MEWVLLHSVHSSLVLTMPLWCGVTRYQLVTGQIWAVGPRVLVNGKLAVCQRTAHSPREIRKCKHYTLKEELASRTRCPVLSCPDKRVHSSSTMTTTCLQDSAQQPSRTAKFLSAVFYAWSSFLITMVNKTVLTSFRWVIAYSQQHVKRSHFLHDRRYVVRL